MNRAVSDCKRIPNSCKPCPKARLHSGRLKPVNYGTLTTSQAADQIANESLLTPGDVLNRYSHYVKQNLQKGYAIELLGFGKLDIKFIKTTTPDEKKATSALVKGMMPNFVGSLQSVSCSTRQLYLLSLFIDLSFFIRRC